MKQRIELLKINGFRGASISTGLDFDSRKKPLVLIFGENGTGKSTIADAIDFVCNKKEGSLEFRSGTGKKHLPTLGQSLADIRIELRCGGDSWTGRHNGAQIIVEGNKPVPQAHILRRNQLLKLVEAQPAERYKTIQSLIDVDGVFKSEKTLRNRHADAEKRVEELVASQLKAEEELTTLWQSERRQDEQHATGRDWAVNRVTKISGREHDEIQQLQRIISALDRIDHIREESIPLAVAESESRLQLDSVVQRLELARKESSGGDRDLIILLQSAEQYVAMSQDLDSCPVCQQPVSARELQQRLGERLRAMSAIQLLQEEADRAQQRYRSAAAATAEITAGYWRQLQTFATRAVDSTAPVLHRRREFWINMLSDQSGLEMSDVTSVSSASSMTGELVALRADATREIEQLQRESATHDFIRQLLESATRAEDELAEAHKLQKSLKQALAIVHDTRLQFTNAILDEVASDCQRMYSRLHPSESIRLTALKMDEKRIGSLEQEASFEGHQPVSPQAYFSDSHLDTLGFCFWLAQARRASGGNAIIVLDDVFTSIDAPHLGRIATLIVEESHRFDQIIMTTHARIWLTYFNSGTIPQGDCCLIKLGRWGYRTGIRSAIGTSDYQRLRTKLDAVDFNRQEVAQLSGIILENQLVELAKQYRCSLPVKDNNEYTLGDLCNGVKKAAQQVRIEREVDSEDGTTKEPAVIEQIQIHGVVESIGQLAFIRNQVGAHFNLDGLDIPDTDVASFGEHTLRFVAMLSCQYCQGAIRSRKGTHFACSCGKTSMKPLELKK